MSPGPVPARRAVGFDRFLPIRPRAERERLSRSVPRDPGEVYEHVNTQLFNVVAPPFNLPGQLPATAPMTAFVTDYVLNYPPDLANPPSYDQYSVIMACFQRNSVAILSTLTRQFAVRPLVLLGAS